MRTQLIAATALAALVSLAGAAQAQTIGQVGASYGRVELDAGAFGKADANAAQLDGSVRFDADPSAHRSTPRSLASMATATTPPSGRPLAT